MCFIFSKQPQNNKTKQNQKFYRNFGPQTFFFSSVCRMKNSFISSWKLKEKRVGCVFFHQKKRVFYCVFYSWLFLFLFLVLKASFFHLLNVDSHSQKTNNSHHTTTFSKNRKQVKIQTKKHTKNLEICCWRCDKNNYYFNLFVSWFDQLKAFNHSFLCVCLFIFFLEIVFSICRFYLFISL